MVVAVTGRPRHVTGAFFVAGRERLGGMKVALLVSLRLVVKRHILDPDAQARALAFSRLRDLCQEPRIVLQAVLRLGETTQPLDSRAACLGWKKPVCLCD